MNENENTLVEETEAVVEETVAEAEAVVAEAEAAPEVAEAVAEVKMSEEEAVAEKEVEPEAAPANDEAQTQVTETVAAKSEDDDTKDGDQDFLAALEETFVKIKPHQFITAKVSQVSDEELCVSIVGYKADGIIKKDDLTANGDVAPSALFKIDDEIEAEVIKMNDGEGRVLLSRKKIESQQKWRELVEDFDQEKIYQCKVTKVIKGGVLSKLDGYDAFIPASQLSLKYVEDLGVFVGETIDVKVIDIDKRQKRFVLSHKEILKAQAEIEEQKMFATFEKGALVKGTVKRLTDFGAFVDIGGVDGLLHITDISWTRIKHPKEILSENQEIEVKIINVDPEKKKISLGYKQLQPRPWDLAPEKYHVGEIVEGKVVRMAPFGAFVELEPTIDGLVHISQVVDRRIEKVEDVLALGQTITAKIMEVNAEKKRISLSMRALIETPKVEESSEEDDNSNNNNSRGNKPRREREERFSYTIPPVEEATTSLADLFPTMDEE